jgi:hypothetical protein
MMLTMGLSYIAFIPSFARAFTMKGC